MAKYYVSGEIVGSFCIEVEAKTEEDAITKALETVDIKDIEDWDTCSKNECDVELIEE